MTHEENKLQNHYDKLWVNYDKVPMPNRVPPPPPPQTIRPYSINLVSALNRRSGAVHGIIVVGASIISQTPSPTRNARTQHLSHCLSFLDRQQGEKGPRTKTDDYCIREIYRTVAAAKTKLFALVSSSSPSISLYCLDWQRRHSRRRGKRKLL